MTRKKTKVGLPVNRGMAAVFWDACDIFHVDYVQRGRTTNCEYYTNLLDDDLMEKDDI